MGAPEGEPSTHGSGSCLTHRQYEMECAEFDALRARSAGHCEACGIPAEESRRGQLVIDHDHRYGMGAVRGLICSRCNTLLGHIESNTSTVDKVTRDRFNEYLRRAWFMQIARWSRLNGPQMSVPGEMSRLIEAVLRSSAVRTITEATGQQPTVEVLPVLMPGRIRYQANVKHSLAEGAGVEIHTTVLCDKKTASRIQSVIFREGSKSVRFDRAAGAAVQIRKTRQRLIAEMAKAERQRLEARPDMERGRIGKPIDQAAAEGW